MMPKNKLNNDTFNDGILNVLEVDNRTILKTLETDIHFGDKTIGVTRSYQASVVGENISRFIAVPYNTMITQQHIVEIENSYYSIKRIQIKHDMKPPGMYLTLERNDVKYADKRDKT